jgi:protein arginine kinase activator
VHLTEIIDEQMTELHLCEECAKTKSMDMEQQFGLGDLLGGLSDLGKTQVEGREIVKLKCSNCGISYEDFRKIGRLGCGECYNSFRKYLMTLLKRIHGSNKHYGKMPLVLTKLPEEKSEIAELKASLDKAIKDEEFEEAARIRDMLKELEKKQPKDMGE